MQMDEESQPLTAFMIPVKGQYYWVTSPMGHLGCPASFQRLMVLRNINNVLVYIDIVLLHTVPHDDHLKVLEKVFKCLHQNHLKVNLDKCIFGNTKVSYLGFIHLKALNLDKSNYRQSEMSSKWSGPLSDCAISSAHTSRILPSLPHPLQDH
jgi:hypothetical protein